MIPRVVIHWPCGFARIYGSLGYMCPRDYHDYMIETDSANMATLYIDGRKICQGKLSQGPGKRYPDVVHYYVEEVTE